MTSKNTWDSWA